MTGALECGQRRSGPLVDHRFDVAERSRAGDGGTKSGNAVGVKVSIAVQLVEESEIAGSDALAGHSHQRGGLAVAKVAMTDPASILSRAAAALPSTSGLMRSTE